MDEMERKALIETVRLEAELNANYDGTAFKLLHRIGRCIEADGKHIDAQSAEIARLRERLTQAIERLRDILQGDDGQAWGEAQRFVDIIAQETQA